MKITVITLLLACMTVRTNGQTSTRILATAERNGKHGCIDTFGNEVVPLLYDNIGYWGNNRIPVNLGAKKEDYSLKGGKWGYCDEKGKLVIPVQFEEAYTFTEGKAAVKTKGKWGFIDLSGQIVIAPQFDEVSMFKEGVCVVAKNKKYGFIDHSGKMVIPLNYDDLFDFNDGAARAFTGKKAYNEDDDESSGVYYLIDKTGKRLTDTVFSWIGWFKNGFAQVKQAVDGINSYDTKVGFINTKGKLVVPPKYDIVEDFSDGLALAGLRESSNEPSSSATAPFNFGYIDQEGIEVIPLQYKYALSFKDGKAIIGTGRLTIAGVRAYSTNGKDYIIENHERYPKFALIDKTGRALLNYDWGKLEAIGQDLYIAQRSKYLGDGVINLTGDTIIPFVYTNLRYAGNGVLIASDGRGRESVTTVLNLKNEVLIKTKHDFFTPEYKYGMLRTRTTNSNKCGFLNLKGEFVIKPEYDMILPFVPTE